MTRFRSLLLALLITLAGLAVTGTALGEDDGGDNPATAVANHDGLVARFLPGRLVWTYPSVSARVSVPAEAGGDAHASNPDDRRPRGHRGDDQRVILPDGFDRSPPLRNAPKAKPSFAPTIPSIERDARSTLGVQAPDLPPTGPDAAVQPALAAASPAAVDNFEGAGNIDGYVPPDTNADVDGQYVVEWVNAAYWVFDKTTGTVVSGWPKEGNAPWASWAGNSTAAKAACATDNSGDPIVKYDRLAQRWILTQFAFADGNSALGTAGPYYQCIAVSQTSDPTGAYYLYVYNISNTALNDYPKVGIQPDGYYFTFNDFDQGSGNYVGATAAVANRAQMIAGAASATMIVRTLGCGTSSCPYSLLAADLDGTTPPPSGSPETFAQLVPAGSINGIDPAQDEIQLFTWAVDWTHSRATWTGPTNLFPFSFNPGPGGAWISEPPGGEALDGLNDRLMYRLAYRNLGSTQIMTVAHTVDSTSTFVAEPRWYELQKPTGGSWSIAQQGTMSYAPNTRYRWMPSMASDHDGNLGMVYSFTGAEYPSVGYTGRLATDPTNLLEAENVLVSGDAGQTACYGDGDSDGDSQPPLCLDPDDDFEGPAGRWGDYSSITLDPTDDCTFWMAGEYFHTGGVPAIVARGRNWHTRIGSFFFPGCMDYAPTAAGFGSQLVIRGKRFENATAVSFNGGAALTWTTDASAHTLTVTVPDTATSGPITVTSPDGTFVGETSFSVVPSISGFLPTSGVPGDTVTISGGPFDGATDVKFNGTSATDFTVDTSTQITATIPNGATSGPISVVVGTATGTSSSSFTVLPYVAGATPPAATVGTKLTINGSGFTGATAVKFNGVSTSFKVVSDTAISTKVPDAGFGPISVTAPGGTVASATNFAVIPTISGLSPSKGSGGRSVSIKGSGFTGVASVTFNGTPAAFTVTSTSRITTTVPVDATSGPVVVTLSGSGQTASSKVFKAQPVITGMSPATGPVGTTVVLTGTNLLEVTSVAIGSAAASFHVDSATQITLTIPSGAKSSKIKVNGPAGNASTSQKFTVTA